MSEPPKRIAPRDNPLLKGLMENAQIARNERRREKLQGIFWSLSVCVVLGVLWAWCR